MKYLFNATLLSLGLLSHHAVAQDYAGYDTFAVKADHRAGLVAASIWYPTGTPTYRGIVGDNAVFQGNSAYVGASVAQGTFPLFVLSHGSGGNMNTISWLSSELALRGAMVLAVNHPGSTSGDSSPRRSIKLDERAKDLSAALDTILSDSIFSDHVDQSQILSLGFSLGGATALNLGGITFDREKYGEYCTEFSEIAEDCIFFLKGGLDFNKLPKGFSAEVKDERITGVIAIDPGMSYAITDESVSSLTLPALLINLGNENRFKAADVSLKGSNLVNRLLNVTFAEISPAHHFTFLAICKANGAAILADEKDDPVCDDPKGTDRAKVHGEIIAKIAEFAKLN